MALPRPGLKRAPQHLALEDGTKNDDDEDEDVMKRKPARAKDFFGTGDPKPKDDEAAKFVAAVKRGRGKITSHQSKLREVKKQIGKKEFAEGIVAKIDACIKNGDNLLIQATEVEAKTKNIAELKAWAVNTAIFLHNSQKCQSGGKSFL